MTSARSLAEIAQLMAQYFPSSEFCASGKRVFFSFSEKAHDTMHEMDKRLMSRHGWNYDKDNDCWSIHTD